MTPYTILFLFIGGNMEYDMVEVWKTKLLELELQRELMSKDKQFTEEELTNMDNMIKHVKKEYTKAVIEKEKENGKNNKNR